MRERSKRSVNATWENQKRASAKYRKTKLLPIINREDELVAIEKFIAANNVVIYPAEDVEHQPSIVQYKETAVLRVMPSWRG